MIELRFVKRKIEVPISGNPDVVKKIEVKILQMRTLDHVVIKTARRVWNKWIDVPLVEPKDEWLDV